MWKTRTVSWYRDSEDDDGTRHYTVEDRWGNRRKVSLTREQRRRMNWVYGAYFFGVLAVIVVGWSIGRSNGLRRPFSSSSPTKPRAKIGNDVSGCARYST